MDRLPTDKLGEVPVPPEAVPSSSPSVTGVRGRAKRIAIPAWLTLWLAFGGTAMVLFLAVYLLDYFSAPLRPARAPLSLLFHFDTETAQNALGNLAQVVVAVLGIVITVVSIVVQLAATRYTPRIATLFFRDRRNLAVMGIFVVTSILALWVSLSVSKQFLPRFSIALTLTLVSLSLLLIIPYFSYVFHFLDPAKIIRQIHDHTLEVSLLDKSSIAERQLAVLDGVEQLADIAVNAVTSRDQLIATSAVDALKDVAIDYLPLKIAQSPLWFALSRDLRHSPDFVSMDLASVNQLGDAGIWVEWKVLRQLMNVYSIAVNDLPDVAHLIAINTRYLGEAALETSDTAVLRLCIKFFNTFVRISLNTQKVRSAYSLLHQYRQLAERLLAFDAHALIGEVASHMRYYAQSAHRQQLGFVSETLAYDLAGLCELAARRRSPAHDVLLSTLLSIDQAPENPSQEMTLRGVRKAQIKLAAAYLEQGNQLAAHQIYLDMQTERPERLRSIYDELMAVHSKEFWEVVDRGTNFDYLEPARKQCLKTFFGWFAGFEPLSRPDGSADTSTDASLILPGLPIETA